jgi:hypothetical protein
VPGVWNATAKAKAKAKAAATATATAMAMAEEEEEEGERRNCGGPDRSRDGGAQAPSPRSPRERRAVLSLLLAGGGRTKVNGQGKSRRTGQRSTVKESRGVDRVQSVVLTRRLGFHLH